MSKPIYPNINIAVKLVNDYTDLFEPKKYHTVISTYLRKKHTDGKWYLQYFNNINASSDIISVSHCIQDFQRSIYLSQQLGIVNPELKNSHYGHQLFELDEDQRSEEERLKEIYS